MRRIITLLSFLLFLTVNVDAQTNVLCEDFTGYDSLNANGNNHWHNLYLSYCTSSATVKCYYTSTTSSGPSGPNSYKFGVDSATLTTPDITSADHINFWMKGNASTGGTLANGAFYIYESPDSSAWTLIDMINPIPAFVATTKQYALTNGTRFVKFLYDKDSGNVAFDDFCATIGAVGIKEFPQNNLMSVYPNPTKGLTSINLNGLRLINASISISNLLGKEIKKVNLKGYESSYPIDLSEFQDGIYFIKVKSDLGEATKRIILRK